jgi:hypothetical protein
MDLFRLGHGAKKLGRQRISLPLGLSGESQVADMSLAFGRESFF